MRSRMYRWLLLPELIALLIVAAGLFFAPNDQMQRQLASRVQLILEQLPPETLELYSLHPGHTGSVICAAEPFGTEPASPGNIEEVQIIYAHYLCALVQRDTPWDYATRSAGPAVITLANPPTVHIAHSGDGYQGRVNALIPDRLQRKAFAGFSDRAGPRDLIDRYNDQIAMGAFS